MRKKELSKQPFAEHLAELRARLLLIVVDFLLGSLIGYLLANQIITWLLYPLHQSVYYTTPIGGFNVILSVSLLVGILFTIPTFLYQSFLFSKPLLPTTLVRKTPVIIFSSFVLLIGGVCFAYFVALPASLHFFSTFSSNNVKSLISATDYLSFVMKYFIGFGILFQLPLVLLLINAATPLSSGKLLSFQRYVIVIAFLVGAVLSPDPFTMCLMAVPIIFLFYFSVFLVWIANKKMYNDS
jgi:sec-independent protein translocase protein TatC